ncbi:hypothetical protein Trco_001356 [Trichoderma cornu-damae]|uniref:Uncharacterized protein n=1 Tax=Trichoderma cornu-damae TaxID=654480 RepID=A0A9P8QS67_9HYPO|nr:hypothetical protein Trco_001356 [Trichoderma cornu-damae]
MPALWIFQRLGRSIRLWLRPRIGLILFFFNINISLRLLQHIECLPGTFLRIATIMRIRLVFGVVSAFVMTRAIRLSFMRQTMVRGIG